MSDAIEKFYKEIDGKRYVLVAYANSMLNETESELEQVRQQAAELEAEKKLWIKNRIENDHKLSVEQMAHIATFNKAEAEKQHARAEKAESQLSAYREALERLRDCDWVITPHDRMDAVRDIARKALTGDTK
jgi:hypothetical protein